MSEAKPRGRKPARAPRPAAPTSTEPALRAVAILLALLTVFLFWDVSLGGRTFVSPDTTAPAGFVRMGEHSLWQDRVYPLWNPYVFLGMPSFASGAYNPLIYPPDWPLALVQRVLPLPEMTWMLLYYFLGALFTVLLARELGARTEAGVIAGVALMFGPNLVAVGSHGHGSQLVNSAYLPLLLWLAVRWMRRGGLHHLAWLALAGGFQLLRGHVQIAFYTWIAVALFVVVDWLLALRRGEAGVATRRALAIPAAAMLAFALAGFYNLPLRAYTEHSIRGGGEGGGAGMDYATQWSLGLNELPTLVLPGWAGFGNQTYWGSMPFTDYPNAFLGIVVVLLAAVAFVARPKAAAGAFAVALGAFALLVALGRHTPLYGLMYDHLPLFNKFRIPVMVVILLQLAAVLGAAWGWTALLARRDDRAAAPSPVDRVLVVAAIVLAAVFVIGVLGQDLWREAYGQMAMAAKSGGTVLGMQGYGPEQALQAWRMTVGSLTLACLLGLATVGVAWLARRGTLSPLVASAILLALLLVDLWPVSARVMQPTIGDPVATRLDAGRDDLVQFFEREQQASPPFRILPRDEFRSNRFAGFGIASVGGYHAAKPKLVQSLLDRGMIETLPWLRLLNVRYMIFNGVLPEPPPILREAYRSPSGQVVYENLAALPRATVLGQWRIAASDTAAMDSIGMGVADPTTVTWLPRDPGIAPAAVEGARATIERYRLNDVTVTVESPAPALMRLADAWYPDWTATVDGQPAEVLRADVLLRAVAVPAGRSTVVFRFESAAQRRGLIVSLAALAVILALLAASWWMSRRRPRPAPVVAEEAA